MIRKGSTSYGIIGIIFMFIFLIISVTAIVLLRPSSGDEADDESGQEITHIE